MPHFRIINIDAPQPTRSVVVALVPRVLQATTSSTSGHTTRTTATSTITSDFFPQPSTLVPPTKPSNSSSSRSALVKSVLEWLLLSVAFILIGVFIMRRMQHRRRAHQPFSSFFSLRRNTLPATPASARASTPAFPRTTGLPIPPIGSSPTFPAPIVRIPFASSFLIPHHSQLHAHPNRRTMGLDTDAGGRRLGVALENDHDGMLGDKDVLPVYDGAGGPPKYFELDALGSGRTTVGGVGYEGVGAFGRTGLGVESQDAEAASPTSLAYPNAPPGDPPSTDIDDPQDHLRPPPVRDSEPEIVAPGLSAPVVPIPIYAESGVDPASSASPSAHRDASLSPPPS